MHKVRSANRKRNPISVEIQLTDDKYFLVTYLKPSASKWSSSSHIERLSTCRTRSNVSCDKRVWVTLSPRKKVLYSKADTIAIKSLNLEKIKSNEWNNIIIRLLLLLWLQMIEIPQIQNPCVMWQINCVNIPSHLFPAIAAYWIQNRKHYYPFNVC